LGAAQAWLSQQREPNRLCVIATDGSWEDQRQCVEVMESMTAAGVQVAVFGIGVDQSTLDGRFPNVMTMTIREAADLGPAVGEMLVNRVKSSLHR